MTHKPEFRSAEAFGMSSMKHLGSKFDDLATGKNQVPRQKVVSFYPVHVVGPKRKKYQDKLAAEAGPLFEHFMASIPCIQEELARVGTALIKLTDSEFASSSESNSIMEIDAFDGTNARAMVSFSEGRLRSYTCSPNTANMEYFEAHADRSLSHYAPISFFDLPPQIPDFEEGFDFIYEMAAFQFYGPERRDQLNRVAGYMRSNGIAIFLEKMNQKDEGEYLLREIAKDTVFKERYFTREEIEWKTANFLQSMRKGQVTLAEFVRDAEQVFDHVKVIWHSTNFYEVVASNDLPRLSQFLCLLGCVAIEPDFTFDQTGGKFP